jgi:hypothetical protein
MQKDAIGPGKRVVIAPEQPRARNLTIFNQESSIHSIMVIEELLQLIRKQEVMPKKSQLPYITCEEFGKTLDHGSDDDETLYWTCLIIGPPVRLVDFSSNAQSWSRQ